MKPQYELTYLFRISCYEAINVNFLIYMHAIHYEVIYRSVGKLPVA